MRKSEFDTPPVQAIVAVAIVVAPYFKRTVNVEPIAAARVTRQSIVSFKKPLVESKPSGITRSKIGVSATVRSALALAGDLLIARRISTSPKGEASTALKLLGSGPKATSVSVPFNAPLSQPTVTVVLGLEKETDRMPP